MNIFEILTAGNSSLTENHITAILAWLIDPYHNHGLGTELLERVVKTCFAGTPLEMEILSSSSKGLLKKSDSKLEVHTELEVEVSNNRKTRRIDIVLTVGNKYVIAIEHKIRSTSVDSTQLEDEAFGLKEWDGLDGKDIYMLYLTPESTEATKTFNALPETACTAKAHLLWTAEDSNTITFIKILQKLLTEESVGSVSPISTELGFILKSLMNFALNDFRVPCGVRNFQSEGSSYFDGYFYGYDELVTASLTNKEIFIGFTKGLAKLEEELRLAQADEQKMDWFIGRSFKWCTNRDQNGKKKGNWIPIKDFLAVCQKFGL